MDLKSIFIVVVLALSGDLQAHQQFSKKIQRRQQRCLNRIADSLDRSKALFGRLLPIIAQSPLTLDDEDDLRRLIVFAGWSRKSSAPVTMKFWDFWFGLGVINLQEYPWVNFQQKLTKSIDDLERSINPRIFRDNYLDSCSEGVSLKNEAEDCLHLMSKLADYIARNYEYIREVQSLSARRANEAFLRSIQISLARPCLVYHPYVIHRPYVVHHHSTVIF